jgi:hypothetical protein
MLSAWRVRDVLAAFERVKLLDADAFDLVIGGSPRQASVGAWRGKTAQAIEDLRAGVTDFEKQLNRELTS